MSEELRYRLKAARHKLGLTQAQAAVVWGVPHPTLKCWENNTRKPKGPGLRKIEGILAPILGGDDGFLGLVKELKLKEKRFWGYEVSQEEWEGGCCFVADLHGVTVHTARAARRRLVAEGYDIPFRGPGRPKMPAGAHPKFD